MNDTAPIEDCVDRWLRHMSGELEGGLDSLLHPDCVFLSPIVFAPQRGREVTKMYLTAAASTLGESSDGEFSYTKIIRDGHQAVLEFETTRADGDGRNIAVNGVDIITCDGDGMITEFRVMIRPLQAINLVHAEMKAMLERLGG